MTLTTVLHFSGPRIIKLGSSAALGLPNSSFTFEAWIKFDGSAPDAGFCILSAGEREMNRGLHATIRGRRPYFGFWSNDLGGRTTLSPDTWYHLAFRYNHTNGEQAIFINGALDAATRGHVAYSGVGDAVIGRIFDGEWFRGFMGELRLWSYARSDQDIAAMRWMRLSGHELNLRGYWPLTEGQGTVAHDARPPESPPLIDGQITPDDAWSKQSLPLTSEQDSDLCSVAQFPGNGGFILVPPNPTLNITGPFTVEAWVMPAPERGPLPLQRGPVVSKHGNLSGWELRCTLAGCSFLITVGRIHYEVSAPPLPIGEWGHLAGVYDGQSLCILINGVVRGTRPISGPIDPFPAELNIGRNPYWPDRSFAGMISEVRIFSRPRPPEEIAPSINSRMKGTESGLVAYWPLGGPVAPNDRRVRDFTVSASYGLLRGAGFTCVTNLPVPDSVDGIAISTPVPAVLLEDNERLRDDLAAARADLLITQVRARATKETHDALLVESQSQIKTIERLQAELTASQQQTADKDVQLNFWKQQVAVLRKETGVATDLGKFISDANLQVKNARDALKDQGSPYSLGRVSLDIKMIPADGGMGMRFPTQQEMEKLGPGLQLSSVSVELVSNETGQKADVESLSVPSLYGYTEVVAKRKLAALGLLSETKYQAVRVVPGEAVQADRVVSQLPQPGARILPSSTVTLFIGRPS